MKLNKLEPYVENLLEELMNSGCSDPNILSAADKIARRTFHDMSCGWIRWDYYIITHIFNGDYKKHSNWAQENCESK